MMWPFTKREKADPLKEEEAKTDSLKQQLHDLREELLRQTVAKNMGHGDDG